MIYALWYKFKGPDAPWIARDFATDRARGQFISRHRKGLSEWAIDAMSPYAFAALDDIPQDSPPPYNVAIHRNP